MLLNSVALYYIKVTIQVRLLSYAILKYSFEHLAVDKSCERSLEQYI